MISASAIQFHNNVTVIVDEAAAKYLQGKDYYYWNFANEPAWEKYR
jgi:glucosamine-6-phosphate deaminase